MRLNIILSVLLIPFIGFCEIYQGGDVLNGLIAWWKMDEQFWNGAAGEVKDYYGSFNGTAVGGAITEIGKIQRAASLDGIDDYINIGTSIDNTISTLSNATFTCWINKSKRGTDNKGIIGLGTSDKRQAWIYVGNNFADGVSASFHNSSGSIKSVYVNGGSPVGKWMFISVVISDNLLSIYTNSVFCQSSAWDGYLNAGSDNNYIGRINSYSNFTGLIDDVRIYNHALSSNELSQIYNYTKDGIKNRSTIYVSGINTNYIAKAIYQGNTLVYNSENRNYPKYNISAKDYVQDGLVAMWDGIENAGWGMHDASAKTWKDLAGNNDITSVTNSIWGEDHLVLGGVGLCGIVPEINDVVTLEIVQIVTSQNGGIISFGQITRQIHSNGTVWFEGQRSYGGVAVTINEPHSQSAIYAEHLGTVFLDGAPATKVTGSSGFNVAHNTLGEFGTYRSKNTLYCIRVYDKALSESEIARNYAIDKARFRIH